MKIILITPPQTLDNECAIVNRMFDEGLEILHLRKPEATCGEMEDYILQIEGQYRNRIVVHSCFELIDKYNLKGAHIGLNRPMTIAGYSRHLSYSCHSIEEVKEQKPHCDYVFLSPIFNSISKQDYTAAFSAEQLIEAKAQHIIDDKVVALGGITLSNINNVRQLGFGGVALLGDVWQNDDPAARLCEYLEY